MQVQSPVDGAGRGSRPPRSFGSLHSNKSPDVRASSLTAGLIGLVIVAALYLGREVLVPIALAVLLSFVLAPPVRLLQGWRVPRVVAVLMVGLVAFSLIFSMGAVMVAR